MMSDVCKHCVTAPCQQACPTGALIHNEFGNVYIQPDICNGCAYCIAACPFGVITRSTIDGHAHKCTLCYDRQSDGLVPACAKACPTESIQFGPIDELRERARKRVEDLHRRGVTDAYLYGDVPGRDLLRAEFVLPPGRSSVGVRASGDGRSTRGSHEGRLSPRGRGGLVSIAVLLAALLLGGATDMHDLNIESTPRPRPPATPTGR